MLEAHLTLAVILAGLIGIAFIVAYDLVFRRIVYDRSDPISLAVLIFSCVLVLTDVLMKFARKLAGEQTNLQDILPWAFIYIVAFFLITFFAGAAHKGLREAQAARVRVYLAKLRKQSAPSHSFDGFQDALQKLGDSMLEPDLFLKNKSKLRKRIEYLRIVQSVARVEIDPETDEAELVVKDAFVQWTAGVMYAVALTVGIAVALFFGLYPFGK